MVHVAVTDLYICIWFHYRNIPSSLAVEGIHMMRPSSLLVTVLISDQQRDWLHAYGMQEH